MRNRLLLNGVLALLAAGCGKTGVMRAPTKVVAEEPEPLVVRVARATPEEPAPSAHSKETPTKPEPVAFQFPDDRGGLLLSKELSPARPLPEPALRPHRSRSVTHLDAPELPLPSSRVEHPVPLPLRTAKPLLPRLVTPETLVGLALAVALPPAKPLPVGERIKETGADINQPAPLPILGQPLLDRAALTDATAEASGAAVIAATMPVRQQPVPFQRLSIPDPFENYRPLRLSLPEEAVDPVTAAPRTPQR